METFSTRWQVEHSNVRSSKPRFPGEIPANPILCLQVGHIGRSRMENLRIPVHKRIDIHISKGRSVRCPTHGVNNGPPLRSGGAVLELKARPITVDGVGYEYAGADDAEEHNECFHHG